MLRIIIKISEILNKIKIIKHETNAHLETIVVFVDQIIKFKKFIFIKTCLKIILNFIHRIIIVEKAFFNLFLKNYFYKILMKIHELFMLIMHVYINNRKFIYENF